MTFSEVQRRAEYDDKCRNLAAYDRRMAEALAAGEKKAGRVCHPLDVRAWNDVQARAEYLAALEYEPGDGLADLPEPIIGEAIETAEEYVAAEGKNSLYMGLCRAETGLTIPAEEITKQRAALDLLKSQSHELAKRLEANGVTAYRETPFSLWHYFVHSRHLEMVPAFRRICLLPYVAAMIRAPMLAAVEAWLERNPFSRFWTFTSGQRVRTCDVRQRVKDLHRKLSTLNAQPFMKAAGVEMVFRSTELGTPETSPSGNANGDSGTIERDADGAPTFHVHAHTIVHLTKGRIPPQRWEKLVRDVWTFWRDHWDADGSIRNARECVKYVSKPGDMLKLSGPELADLSRALYRLKLVQPMGALAEEIAKRKEKGHRLIRTRTPDGRVYKAVPDWNKSASRTEREKNMEAARKLDAKEGEGAPRIVARLLPSIGPAGVKEPRVIVMAKNWDERAVRLNPLVARLVEHTGDEFRAGYAIRVHTCTSTVGETRPLFDPLAMEPPRRPPTGAELAGLSR